MGAEIRGWLISGRVQGVFFRASTSRQAQALGLSGYAINLPDGRVEVAASGSAEALDRLENWLHQGPRMARVDRVERFNPEPERLGDKAFSTG